MSLLISILKCLEKKDNLIRRINGKDWYTQQEYCRGRGGEGLFLRSSWTGCQ